jgi:dihydrofolate synthase/folylpolyglutamate synthase
MAGFTMTHHHIRDGIAQAAWPARLQRLSTGALAALLPQDAELWLDGGHNPGAGEILGRWARAQKKPVHLLCGMLKGKDTVQFLAPLAPFIRSLTAVAIEGEPLGQPPDAIAAAARSAGIEAKAVHQAGSVKIAIQNIVNNNENNTIILICGSLYLAGNILWQNSQAA